MDTRTSYNLRTRRTQNYAESPPLKRQRPDRSNRRSKLSLFQVRKSASQVRGAMTPVKQPPRPPPPTADQLAEAVPEEIGEAPVKKDNPIGVSITAFLAS